MNTKFKDLLLFISFYILAYIGGFLAIHFTDCNMTLKLFIFDLIATFIIYICSLLICNSSLYDAYWSLTPMVMIIYLWIIKGKLDVYLIVFTICFLLWSLRLTINWIHTFQGRSWEDWRYKKLRELPKPLWHIANFFGIMFMPTLLVFLGFIPVIYLFDKIIPISLIGCFIILIGTLLEFLADLMMHQFLQEDHDKKVCRKGLWKYSRHPNYLGEILIWIGVFVAFIPTNTTKWYLVSGCLLMVCLFEFISIPLMEKRQKSRRADYHNYINQTSRLLLLPRKRNFKDK